MTEQLLWWLILGSFCVTYLWRGMGVVISSRVETGSLIFKWVSCVAYAMLAALVSRMIFLPAGPLEATQLYERLLACGVAVLVYFLFKKNLIAALVSGVATIILLNMP